MAGLVRHSIERRQARHRASARSCRPKVSFFMSRIPQRNITQGFIVIDVMSVHDRPQTDSQSSARSCYLARRSLIFSTACVVQRKVAGGVRRTWWMTTAAPDRRQPRTAKVSIMIADYDWSPPPPTASPALPRVAHGARTIRCTRSFSTATCVQKGEARRFSWQRSLRRESMGQNRRERSYWPSRARPRAYATPTIYGHVRSKRAPPPESADLPRPRSRLPW